MNLKKGSSYPTRHGILYRCTSVQNDGILKMRCVKYLPEGMPIDSPDAIWMGFETAKKNSLTGKPYRCSGRMELDPVTGNEVITEAHECKKRPDYLTNALIDNIPAVGSIVHYNGLHYSCTSNKNGISRCRCQLFLPYGISPQLPNVRWYSSLVHAKSHQQDKSQRPHHCRGVMNMNHTTGERLITIAHDCCPLVFGNITVPSANIVDSGDVKSSSRDKMKAINVIQNNNEDHAYPPLPQLPSLPTLTDEEGSITSSTYAVSSTTVTPFPPLCTTMIPNEDLIMSTTTTTPFTMTQCAASMDGLLTTMTPFTSTSTNGSPFLSSFDGVEDEYACPPLHRLPTPIWTTEKQFAASSMGGQITTMTKYASSMNDLIVNMTPFTESSTGPSAIMRPFAVSTNGPCPLWTSTIGEGATTQSNEREVKVRVVGNLVWECLHCTYENTDSRFVSKCQMCLFTRSSLSTSRPFSFTLQAVLTSSQSMLCSSIRHHSETALITLLHEMRTLEQQFQQETTSYVNERADLLRQLTRNKEEMTQLQHDNEALRCENASLKTKINAILAIMSTRPDDSTNGPSLFMTPYATSSTSSMTTTPYATSSTSSMTTTPYAASSMTSSMTTTPYAASSMTSSMTTTPYAASSMTSSMTTTPYAASSMTSSMTTTPYAASSLYMAPFAASVPKVFAFIRTSPRTNNDGLFQQVFIIAGCMYLIKNRVLPVFDAKNASTTK
jgi:hypothetical protein